MSETKCKECGQYSYVHAEKGRIAHPVMVNKIGQLANLINQIAGLAERKCAQEKELRNEIAELLATVELCNSEKDHYKERARKLEDELRNYAVHPASKKRLGGDW